MLGQIRKFSPEKPDAAGVKFKVPHMGWNRVEICRAHPIFEGIDNQEYFYFVHSYFVEPVVSETVIGETTYCNSFTSAVAFGNLVAVQFHPEKSQHAGLKLLSNFLNWDGQWTC